jgi:Ca2+-binding RTX toxin-like protein
MSYPTTTIESTITTTLVIFDSQVADLPLLYNALLPGSIGHTIQPHQDPINHITHLLTQTGATKLAIVAHGQPGSIQIGNGKIDRATLETRSGLLQEWGLDSIALYSCEVGVDVEFVRRFAELTGAKISASTGKLGAGNWELAGGLELLEIDRLADYNSTLAIFYGTSGNDTANPPSISGFSDGNLFTNDLTLLTDTIGDIFNGGDGYDTIYAGSGDDRINSSYLKGSNNGGSGNDFLYVAAAVDNQAYNIIFDGANNGRFQTNGTNTGNFSGIEQLYFLGYGGNDIVDASLANLSVTIPGTGFNPLSVTTGSGSDTVLGSANADSIDGQNDNDFLYGNAGNDFLYGGGGFDIIFGQAGDDTLYGGAENDTLLGGVGNDTFYGDSGTDLLYGEEDNDTLNGGDANDFLFGQAGDDRLNGDAGNDYLFGGIGNDTIYGGIGVDEIYGEDGNDEILGGDDNDFLFGQAGNDILIGEAGNDYLVGGDGTDDMYGGIGSDILIGENGNDYLIGGDGNDYLVGGTGTDSFNYYSMSDAGDIIADFSLAPIASGGDILDVSALLDRLTNPGNNYGTNYLKFVQLGSDVACQVDRDGTAAAYGFETVATMTNVGLNTASSFVIGTNVIVVYPV